MGLRAKENPLAALAALAGLLVAASIALIFFYVPTDADQGFSQRIFYIHVPIALTAYAFFAWGAWKALRHLWKREPGADLESYVAIHQGVIFGSLTLLTGSLWAKISWGHWWLWSESQLVLFLVLFLFYGGVGLPTVETRDWGGLMLTLFIAVYAGLLAVPLGILLALGRQSRLPAIRTLAVLFIEFWRGVPIIAVIFLASLILPLIVPSGIGIDRLARAVIGLALVIAAYMAEAVRGGLQAVPKGQYEAATALGLRYPAMTVLIVLPQALRIALPAMTNEFIALLKNTSLVLIVSILDLLGVAQAALADPAWVGMTMEAYVFAGAIYWLLCFTLSRASLRLERRAAMRR